MFKENDLVMYGKAGVCRITKIGVPDFATAEDDALYYFLEPLYRSGTFYAPVKGKGFTLRAIISGRKAKSLISGIDDMECQEVSTVSIQQLSQHYQSIVDGHKCDELLAMVKSIYAKNAEAAKHNKKLGQIDKRYMKMAEDLLYGELAVALGKEKDELEQLVTEKLLASVNS